MSYYIICDSCGANLDPGEKCDCLETLDENNKTEDTNNDDNPQSNFTY